VYDATGLLAAGQTSATLEFSTTFDNWYPGALAIMIDTVAPELDGAGTTKAAVDLDGPPALPGDVVEYTVTVANSGTGPADDVVVSDPLPESTTFVPGSLVVDGAPQSDASGDDLAELDPATSAVTARLGAGASPGAGGTLGVGTDATFTFQVTLDAQAAGTTVTNTATIDHTSDASSEPLVADVGPTELAVSVPPPEQPTTLPPTTAPPTTGGSTTLPPTTLPPPTTAPSTTAPSTSAPRPVTSIAGEGTIPATGTSYGIGALAVALTCLAAGSVAVTASRRSGRADRRSAG
jgi:uncharacterized repeat protein (TIGR01451 family)